MEDMLIGIPRKPSLGQVRSIKKASREGLSQGLRQALSPSGDMKVMVAELACLEERLS